MDDGQLLHNLQAQVGQAEQLVLDPWEATVQTQEPNN
jgi:hypothetical protein